jgi:hypothetical protein
MWKSIDDMWTGSNNAFTMRCICDAIDVKRESSEGISRCRVVGDWCIRVHTGTSPFYDKANYVGKDD